MEISEVCPPFTKLNFHRRAIWNGCRPEPVCLLDHRKTTVLQRPINAIASNVAVFSADQLQPLIAFAEHLNNLLFQTPQITLKVADNISEDTPVFRLAAGEQSQCPSSGHAIQLVGMLFDSRVASEVGEQRHLPGEHRTEG